RRARGSRFPRRALAPLPLGGGAEARRARPDALDARLGGRGALGIDADEAARREGGNAGLKGARVLVHLVGIVLATVDGDGPARSEEAAEEGIPEERRGGEVVHLAVQYRAAEGRGYRVVRVVGTTKHRTPPRHALGVMHVDRPEEEPDPEAAHRPHHRVEGIHAARHLPRNRLRVAGKSSARSTTRPPVKSTCVPRSDTW